MKGPLCLMMGALILGSPMPSESADQGRVAKCEADWTRLSGATRSDGHPIDKAGLLERWLALEPACRGTGVFEYRLATLYVSTGQPERALPLLGNAESWPGDYPKVAPFVRLNAQMKIYLAQKPFPRDKFSALKPEFLAALAHAPNTAIANEQTSHYLMMIGDYSDAIKYATKSLAIDHNQWEANRTLTISQAGSGKFVDAIASGVRTQQLNSEITSDPLFMYAWSRAYAGSGDIATAKQILAALAGTVPAERGTDEWKSAIEFIREQIRAGNDKK